MSMYTKKINQILNIYENHAILQQFRRLCSSNTWTNKCTL